MPLNLPEHSDRSLIQEFQHSLSSVALIASFRKHYKQVLAVREQLTGIGMQVTSPRAEEMQIINPDDPFIRFTVNDAQASEAQIQSEALERIFKADFVYAVDPEGYVGNTVCYEIGRIMERKQPLYFQEAPVDLPIDVSDEHIIGIDELCEHIRARLFLPRAIL